MTTQRKRRTANRPKPAPRATVVVRVSGGVITDVEAPDGVEVVVYDYDIGGGEEELAEDEAGEECVKTTYGGRRASG